MLSPGFHTVGLSLACTPERSLIVTFLGIESTWWHWGAHNQMLGYKCPRLFLIQHPLGSLQHWGVGSCLLELEWPNKQGVVASRKPAGLCQYIAQGSDTYFFGVFQTPASYAQIVQACSKWNKFSLSICCMQKYCTLTLTEKPNFPPQGVPEI